MIKFDKNIWFFNYILCFLVIFNLALLYRIPLVLPISGIIVLCILPGYLICLFFEIKVTDNYENFLYTIGLSILFDLLFCLLINTLLPLFGINNPLSSQNLQIGFSFIILILTSLIVYTLKAPKISLKLPKLFKIEKIFLTFAFAILVSIQIGIYLVNADITNFFLIFSIFLIPILLIFLIIFHNNSIKRIYPLILYLIGFSLLMLLTFRSNYIIGIDTHEEFYFFYTTFIHSVWVPDPSFLLSASLSISILPTIFARFFDINPQLLFKILYPLLFSIIPLIIYVIVKKYADELLAIFASCYFMFQTLFILTTYNGRTSTGIFFVAFAILILCNKELLNWKKYMLFMLFIAGIIFSHYTTALIFLGMISLAYLIDLILNRYINQKEKRFINFPLIFYFSSLTFFWYQQIINNVFTTGLYSAILRIAIFNDLLKQDVGKYIYPSLRYSSALWYYTRFTKVLIFILMGIGILFVFFCWLKKKNQRNSFPKLIVNINRDLFFLGIVAIGLLLITVFAPFLFFTYDTDRTKELIDIVLPVFLILGSYNLFIFVSWYENLHCSNMKFHNKIAMLKNYCKSYKNQIISGILLFLLLPSLLFATGITYQVDGIPYSLILNSPKISKNIDFGYAYIFDQDAKALEWIKINSQKDSQIFSDGYGNKKITSLLNQNTTLYQKSLVELSDQNLLDGYIFLTVTNEHYGILKELDWKETTISQFGYILNQKNKIFSNGGVLFK
jgi:uncharacterized membrane protein